MIAHAQRMPDSPASPSEPGHVHDDVWRAQRGDVAAFERIYHSCAPAIYALCSRMTQSETEARELVQDAFVRAWERLSQFHGRSSLETWLHRLAVNVVLEHLRRSKRDASRLFVGDEEDFGAARQPELDAQMDLGSALEKLPPGSRAVLVLHDIEGYSHDEIATMTGIAPGTARAQLWRARRALMRLLDV